MKCYNIPFSRFLQSNGFPRVPVPFLALHLAPRYIGPQKTHSSVCLTTVQNFMLVCLLVRNQSSEFLIGQNFLFLPPPHLESVGDSASKLGRRYMGDMTDPCKISG